MDMRYRARAGESMGVRMRVAITGSAGTGKTTAAKALAARGEVASSPMACVAD